VRAQSIDEVLALYERWGTDLYDEALSQLDHALQTAALAVSAGAPDELVVASLLHDVGHLLDLAEVGPGQQRARDLHHETVGAAYLADLFPRAVTAPIALHVRAKRYLCAADPSYHQALSPGSQRSLALQGGPMSAREADAFEQLDGADEAVRLRRWDDEGKVDGLAVPALGAYRARLEHQVC
jgi:phosphonate degradation associated HDIG domain protein